MTFFVPMSGITLELANDTYSNPEPVTYVPSIMGDVTASADYLLCRDSCQSFNDTQFRMAAENMIGLGAVASFWA